MNADVLSSVNTSANKISTFERAVDYIPGLSSFPNAYYATRKMAGEYFSKSSIPPASNGSVQRTYTALDARDLWRCFVLIFLPVVGNILVFIYDQTYNNEDWLLNRVKDNPSILKHAAKALKRDPEFMKAAATENSAALEYANPLLLDSEGFMGPLAENDPEVLKYASDRLRDSEAFMEPLAENDPEVLKYASDRLKGDGDFMEPLARLNADVLGHAKDVLLKAPAFMGGLAKDNLEGVLPHTNQELLKSPDFMLNLGENPEIFPYLRNLKANPDFMSSLMQKNNAAAQILDSALRNDREYLRSEVLKTPSLLPYFDEVAGDPDFVLPLVPLKIEVLRYVDSLDVIKKSVEKYCELISEGTVQGNGKDLWSRFFEAINPDFLKNQEFVSYCTGKTMFAQQAIQGALSSAQAVAMS